MQCTTVPLSGHMSWSTERNATYTQNQGMLLNIVLEVVILQPGIGCPVSNAKIVRIEHVLKKAFFSCGLASVNIGLVMVAVFILL